MRTGTLFGPPTRSGFVSTKGHRRFESFCDDVARYRCIGVCVGPAGVGKTASARRYSKWDVIEPRYPRFSHTEKPPPEVASVRSVFYTPPVVSRPRLIASEVEARRNLVNWFAAVAQQYGEDGEERTVGTIAMAASPRSKTACACSSWTRPTGSRCPIWSS